MLSGKTIAVGVSGSISAYKAADLTSRLVKLGCDVRVLMTDAAARFISDLTLEVLSRHHVVVGAATGRESVLDALAREAGLMIVAPASANTVAHLAHAVDAGCVSYVASRMERARVLVAPAMNVHMYRNAATQANLDALASRGIVVIPPASGMLACGDEGEGKLPSVDELVDWAVRASVRVKDLAGTRIVVSAGPTREALDPVRFLTNRSTGRMGYAIARQAMLRGADVTLVSGPVDIPAPRFAEVVGVESAADMFEAVTSRASEADAVIMAAAVADYRPATRSASKIKKKDGDLSLPLERTQDILAWLGAHRTPRTRLCGFSMETDDVLENSRAKLVRKGVDMIAANSLRETGAGFGTPTNRLTLITAQREIDLPMLSKDEAAGRRAVLAGVGRDGMISGVKRLSVSASSLVRLGIVFRAEGIA